MPKELFLVVIEITEIASKKNMKALQSFTGMILKFQKLFFLKTRCQSSHRIDMKIIIYFKKPF